MKLYSSNTKPKAWNGYGKCRRISHDEEALHSEISNDDHVASEDELLMHSLNTLPRSAKKFWRRRYSLFSKYDEGIMMTLDMWYLVTPEKIAIATARILAHLIGRRGSVLEVCCGAGGNTIAFAQEFNTVVAIDISANNTKCTENNARVYGVADKISCITRDWNVLSSCDTETGIPNTDWIPSSVGSEFDVGFCSPPWGGPSYDNGGEYDVLTMQPLALDVLLRQTLQYTRNVGVFLPKSSCLDKIRSITRDVMGPEADCRVIYAHDDGRCKALIALFGPDVSSKSDYYETVFDTMYNT